MHGKNVDSDRTHTWIRCIANLTTIRVSHCQDAGRTASRESSRVRHAEQKLLVFGQSELCAKRSLIVQAVKGRRWNADISRSPTRLNWIVRI